MSDDPLDLSDLGDEEEDSPDKTRDDGTLEEPNPSFDYSDTSSDQNESGSNTGGDPLGGTEDSGTDWSVRDLDLDETDEVSEEETGVNEEQLEEEQQRFGFGAFNTIKEKIWRRPSIPSMPELPSRDRLPSGSDLTGWRPDFLQRAEKEAEEETSEADPETAEEDPESSVDEDESVDNPDVDEAVEDEADETQDLPQVQIQMPDESEVAPLEDTFKEEREFLRHNQSAQGLESAINNAISSLSKGNQGLINTAQEVNQNLEQITSRMMEEVVQNDVDEVEGWINRWKRVNQYVEFISSRTGAVSTNSVELEKNLLNGKSSFNADGRNFLNNYAGLQDNHYGLRQVSEDLERILQGYLRPLGGSADQEYSNEVQLMKNLVSELEKSQRIYSRMVVLRLNLDVIEEQQGDFVKLISEIEGGAVRDNNLRKSMKAELESIQEGEKELADIARLEDSILKNMMEANKIVKRLYEVDSHEFENLYQAGEGRQGLEEDLRNLIESLNVDRGSKVYDEFQDIREMAREVAELSEKITREKADEIEWYIKVSKMISKIIEAEKHHYRSVAEEESSYEAEVDEEAGEAEESEVSELNELEQRFIRVYDEYIEVDADNIVSELEDIRPELKDMVKKTDDEENKFRNVESDVEELKEILEGVQKLENKATNGDISKEEFRNQVIKGAGQHSLTALSEKLNEVKSFLEGIEQEEHVLKEEHEDLKAKFSHLINQLDEIKELREEVFQIHHQVEDDGVADEFGERVNSEIGMNYMRFIGNLENADDLQGIIEQDKKLLEKETKLEAEEIEMLKEISEEMSYLVEADYSKIDLSDHGRKKIQDMKKALKQFNEEIQKVREVKAEALNLDREELESF